MYIKYIHVKYKESYIKLPVIPAFLSGSHCSISASYASLTRRGLLRGVAFDPLVPWSKRWQVICVYEKPMVLERLLRIFVKLVCLFLVFLQPIRRLETG